MLRMLAWKILTKRDRNHVKREDDGGVLEQRHGEKIWICVA